MASHVWLSLSCQPVKSGGCGRCFRHCTCANKNQRLGKGPLADLAREAGERIKAPVAATRVEPVKRVEPKREEREWYP